MTLVLILSSCMILAGVLIWCVSRGLERQENSLKIQSLEAKLQLAQNRSNQLGEQISRVQNEFSLTQQQLEKERHEKAALIRDYAEPLRKFNLVLILLGISFGLLFGSLMAATYTEKVYMKKMTQIEVARAVAETRMRDFQAELEKLESNFEELQRTLQLEMEARIIAQTKLEILLHGDRAHFKDSKSFFGLGKSRREPFPEEQDNSALLSIPLATSGKVS